MWERKIRHLLRSKLAAAQGTSPKASMRDFAAKLELSSGALSELLSGKRRLSPKAARKLLPLLDLEAADCDALLKAIEGQRRSRSLLPADAYELMSNWQYFAVISLLELDVPPDSVSEVADRLKIAPDQAEEILQTLLDYELVTLSESGKYRSTNEAVSTTDNVSSIAIREGHEKNLQLGIAALKALSVEERDFTSVTFSANEAQLEEAKEEIRRFRDRLALTMSQGHLNEVFQLNVQLFPLKNWERPS